MVCGCAFRILFAFCSNASLSQLSLAGAVVMPENLRASAADCARYKEILEDYISDVSGLDEGARRASAPDGMPSSPSLAHDDHDADHSSDVQVKGSRKLLNRTLTVLLKPGAIDNKLKISTCDFQPQIK